MQKLKPVLIAFVFGIMLWYPLVLQSFNPNTRTIEHDLDPPVEIVPKKSEISETSMFGWNFNDHLRPKRVKIAVNVLCVLIIFSLFMMYVEPLNTRTKNQVSQ